MNGTDVLWSIPGAQALAWALVQFLWQGAAVALALAGVLALLRGRSSSLRYALAAGALAAMLVWPALTVLGSLDRGGVPEVRLAGLLAARTAEAPREIAGSVETPAEASLGAVSPAAPSRPGLRELVEPLLPGLLAFWVAGVVVLSLYHVGGWLEARRLTRSGTRPAAAPWEAMLADLRRRLGIERAVRLLESTGVAVPSVVGCLRPVVLVPASVLSGLTPEQVEAVLAHELAHVRRHDYLVNLLQTLVETLFFYHPAVWWVSRQMRLEREYCCDDLALSVCGDRLRYARALATLEELRLPSPRLAMAANGGPLLRRIRRIVGLPAKTRPSAGLAGALTLALFLSGAALESARTDPAPAPEPRPAAVVAEARAPEPEPQTAENERRATAPSAAASKSTGQWAAERKANGVIRLELMIRHKDGKGRMNNSFELRESDLVGLGAGPEARFELRRAAGTFRFEGRFDGTGPGAKGAGLFYFTANPEFPREMASLGYRIDGDKVLELAIFDVSPAFVRELRAAGYDDLSLKQLVEFRIFKVTPAFIREMAEVGYRDLSAQRLVEARIHGVDPEFIREMAAIGLRDLPFQKLVEMRIHGVTEEFIRELAEHGYKDLPLNRLVDFRIHGVTPGFLRELAELGYRNVDPNDLVAMRIHGVDADFIREMEKRGRKGLSPDELVELRIFGGRGPGRHEDEE